MDEGIKGERLSTKISRQKFCSVKFSLRLYDIFDCIIYLLVVLVVCWSYPFHHDVRSSKATLCRRHGLHFQRVQIHVHIPSPGV